MNLERIEAVLGLFQQARVSELEVEGEGWRVGLRKHLQGPPLVSRPAAAPTAVEEPETPVTRPPRAVNASLVGLFRAANPPVRAGDEVTAGQPLGAIDSMGIQNPVTAPIGGRVLTMAVGDGDGVQYGQLLVQLAEESEPTAGV